MENKDAPREPVSVTGTIDYVGDPGGDTTPESEYTGPHPVDTPRRRGRPPGSGNKQKPGTSGPGTSGPGTSGTPGPGTPGPGTPGPGPGPKVKIGGPKGTAHKNAVDPVKGIASMLVGIHTMLAAISGVPELEIDEQEGRMLGSGILDVAAQYDIFLSEKQVAWSNFLMACGMIYGSRYQTIRIRQQINRKKLAVMHQPTAK